MTTARERRYQRREPLRRAAHYLAERKDLTAVIAAPGHHLHEAERLAVLIIRAGYHKPRERAT